MMERIDRICRHPLWLESVEHIAQLERDRVFCRHDVAHFLDVARLAYIESLERGLDVSKEEIYAAALLHDIGRHLQYTRHIPHDRGSAMLAETILPDCGFSPEEQARIQTAVLEHRDAKEADGDELSALLYRADKASRACMFCRAHSACNWSPEKKNLTLKG